MAYSFGIFSYKENLPEQRILFNDCFPETLGDPIQSEEHYFWKFHSFPDEKKSFEYVCYDDDVIVGYYAAIPYKYKIGDLHTNIGMVCDVMTNPNYRGKGIFTKLGEYSTTLLSSSVPLCIGYPIRKEVIPGHLKIGWKIAFKLPLYIKFYKVDSLFDQRKLGGLSKIVNPFISLFNKILVSHYNKNLDYSINDSIDEIDGYEEFTKKWASSVPNSLIKDYQFAKWRYGAPGRKYKFITIYLNNEIVSFVALRKIIKEGIPSYGILDYMVLPGYNDSHGLINKVLWNEAKSDGVHCALCMMSKYSARVYKLAKNGFMKSPFIFSLIIKNLTNQFRNEDLYNEMNWHLMWVDSDDL
jgi:hypothetical protein